MAHSFVQSDSLTTLSKTPSPGCQFENDQGLKCGLTKLLARGYCPKHYRQLQRSGVFTELSKRTNDPSSEDLVSVNADKLLKAKDRLERLAPYAVVQFKKAIKLAADKGDHKPAKDLLLLSKAIEPIEKVASFASQSGVLVKVGVRLAGLDPQREDIVIESEPTDGEVVKEDEEQQG